MQRREEKKEYVVSEKIRASVNNDTEPYSFYHDVWVRHQGIRENVWQRDSCREGASQIQQQRADRQEGSYGIHLRINMQSSRVQPETAGVLNVLHFCLISKSD